MDDQNIKTDQDFKVSGSDTEKTATGTGELNYKLEVDNTSFTIGSTVTASITPVTSGLVHATIESCAVKNTVKDRSVTLIGDGMKRTCALGVDVTAAQGTSNLGFTWSSFKWSTELVGGNASPIENQEVSCKISLSKAQPTAQPKKKRKKHDVGPLCYHIRSPFCIKFKHYRPRSIPLISNHTHCL